MILFPHLLSYIWMSTSPFHSSFKTALEPAGAAYQKHPVVSWLSMDLKGGNQPIACKAFQSQQDDLRDQFREREKNL